MNFKKLLNSKWAQFGVWMFGIYAIVLVLEFLVETELTQWWTILLLAVALHLIFSSPMVSLGIPRSLEISISTVAIMIVLFHLGMAVVYPKIAADDEDSKPCGRKTREYQCYNLSKTVCLSAFEHYQAECLTEVRAKAAGPTQLIGSEVRRCLYDRFKRYMSYNLKMDAPALCKQ